MCIKYSQQQQHSGGPWKVLLQFSHGLVFPFKDSFQIGGILNFEIQHRYKQHRISTLKLCIKLSFGSIEMGLLRNKSLAESRSPNSSQNSAINVISSQIMIF